MPMKRGAGGRMQNYDSYGRYAKAVRIPPMPTRKEKARQREERKREELFNRARKSKDPYLFDVYIAIETEMPGEVVAVNAIKEEPHTQKRREFDIITKKFIIEVKGGSGKDKTKQYFAQRDYAIEKRKQYIIVAPNMPYGTKKYLTKAGLVVVDHERDLIRKMKEYNG